jgi:ABC-type multidrug transport system fused ATPase/permease subunit
LLLIGLLIFKVGAGAAAEINKHSEELKAQQQKQLAQLASAPSSNTYRDPLELEIEGTSRQSEANAIQRIQTISKSANGTTPLGPGMTAPQSADEMQKEMVESVMKKVGPRLFPLALGLLIALLWGAFYFPTALAVAGYTESIGATLNPLVGFGMMRQMGANYFKASGGYALLTIVAFAIYIAVGVVSMIIGQAVAQFFINIVAFYFYIATGALFGFALYRSHKKIGFQVS